MVIPFKAACVRNGYKAIPPSLTRIEVCPKGEAKVMGKTVRLS